MDKEKEELEYLRYLYQEMTYHRLFHHTVVTWAVVLYTGFLALLTWSGIITGIVIWLAICSIVLIAIIFSILIVQHHSRYKKFQNDIYEIYTGKTHINQLMNYFNIFSGQTGWCKVKHIMKSGWHGYVLFLMLVIGGAVVLVVLFLLQSNS